MATSAAQLYVSENRFYGRAGLGLACTIFVGFALLDLMAAIEVTKLPLIVHIHAAVMSAWLALFIVQNRLGAGRDLALHRKLGWIGAGLAAAVVLSGWLTGFTSIVLGRFAPNFSASYFFALTLLEPVAFAGLTYWAIALRRRTDWHRRIMLGALIVLLEPLFGRWIILVMALSLGSPEPALAYLGQRQWLMPVIEIALQAAVLSAIMLRDRSLRGAVHPALWSIGAVVAGMYAAVTLLGLFPPFVALTASLPGSAS
jgi:hypothetical protein